MVHFMGHGCCHASGDVCTFLVAKNNRSKSVCTLFQRKHLIIKQFGRLFSA